MNTSIEENKIKDDELLTQSRRKEKRLDYIDWDEYFMAMTFLELRKCPKQSVSDAAIVLNQRKIIISIASSHLDESNTTADYFNHAEYKALCKIQEGAVMYTTSFPCEKCAEAIIQADILEVIYYRDCVNSDKVKKLLAENGVESRQFISNKQKIEIDFSKC